MRIFMVTAGLLLILSAIRLRAKTHTLPMRLFLASLICGGLGLIVWVPDDSLALDRVLHTPGVGHLLTIWLITLCFTLQFAFGTTLTARWTRLRRGAYALYGLLLLAYTIAWLLVHITLGARFPTLAYGEYRAGPPGVLAMDLASSGCIILAGLLGVWGYRRMLVTGRRFDERLGAGAASSVFVGGVAYGGLAFAQTLASSRGAHGIGGFGIRIPIILVSAAVAPLTIWSITYLQLYWRRIRVRTGHEAAMADLQQREEQLRQRQEEFYQLRLDLLDAQTLIDDAIARLQHFADPAVVEDVADYCTKRNLSPYQQRVAIEAAIWTTAMRERAAWTPWAGLSRMVSATTLHDPQQLQLQAEQAHAFTVDTLRVVLLALGARQLPDAMAARAEPPGWRRRAAALLRYALRIHGYNRASLLGNHAS